MNKELKTALLRGALAAEDEFTDDELETAAAEFRRCPVDGGEGESLGLLGTLHHFRCRQCGAQFAQSVVLP